MSDQRGIAVEALASLVRDKQTRYFASYAAIAPEKMEALDRALWIEIVYASNALEGNTLTAAETALVLEEGIAIGGKSIHDHLLALDHAHALDTIDEIGRSDNQKAKFRPISQGDFRLANYLLVQRTGRGWSTYVRQTDDDEPPVADEPPQSIVELVRWLKTQPDAPETAIRVHNSIVRSQPFLAANAPTARLMLNFILIRGGYPPIAIRPEDAGECGLVMQSDEASQAFDIMVLRRLDQTLELYIDAAERSASQGQLLREP